MRAFISWWRSLTPMGRINHAANVPLGIVGALFLKGYLTYNWRRKKIHGLRRLLNRSKWLRRWGFRGVDDLVNNYLWGKARCHGVERRGSKPQNSFPGKLCLQSVCQVKLNTKSKIKETCLPPQCLNLLLIIRSTYLRMWLKSHGLVAES